MGCINTSATIKVKSIRSFKREIIRNIKENEGENIDNKDFSFSDFTIEEIDDSNSSDEKSRILFDAKVQNNELIFL